MICCLTTQHNPPSIKSVSVLYGANGHIEKYPRSLIIFVG